jgi:hypothetical protein
MTKKLSGPLLLLVQCIGMASEVALRNRYLAVEVVRSEAILVIEPRKSLTS